MPTVQDEMIEHIRIVLKTPARTYQEIADRLTARLGQKITRYRVSNYLVILRRHPDYYEWTVPHVRHGLKADGSDDKRFFRLNVKRNGGDYVFDTDPEKLHNFRGGSFSVIAETASKVKNQVAMLHSRLDQTHTATQRLKLNDLIRDGDYYARKVEQFLEAIEDEAA
jgi:hypothetical protein